jgi:hypothetical protein
MKLRSLIPTFAVALAFFSSVGAAPAVAEPIWNLGIHHNETNFAPGAAGPAAPEYWFSVENVGPDDSSGLVTLTVQLPDGLARQEVRQANTTSFNAVWSCPGNPGDTVVVCTTTTPIPHHTVAAGLVLAVTVDHSAGGTLITQATLAGGDAPSPASAVEPTEISSQSAPFGIVPFSAEAGFFGADGTTPRRSAGSHPELLTVALDFSSVAEPLDKQPPFPDVPENKTPAGTLRDLRVDFPPGFTGYPAVVGECRPDQLMANACPPSSQVGRIDATTLPVSSLPNTTFTQFSTSVFNMVHPKGVVSDLAFQVANNPIHVRVSLDPSRDYALTSKVTGANETLPVFFQKMTLWGVPADASHDSERCPEFINGGVGNECAAGVPPKPFLSLPSNCDQQNAIRISEYDSWQDTGVFGPDIELSLGQMTDCEKPSFGPSADVEATSDKANSPTGLDVRIHVPQNFEPNGQATPPVKDLRLTLPQGITLSPTFAQGLQACTQAQIGLGDGEPVLCPGGSRIGSVSVQTPMLAKQVEGSLYLAQQGANPFHAPLAVYLALRDSEERGILVKIPGRLDLDGETGQISTVFENLPQMPFEDVSVHLREGEDAPLLSTLTCGSQPVRVQVDSWAQPDKWVEIADTIDVTQGSGGSACPRDLGGRPFAPKMSAGTISPLAGAYSPFVFRLTREDREQEVSRIDTMLPPGVTAKIAGIPFCPEATIASISSAEGAGRTEAASPVCPPASRIGSVDVGVGAGAFPAYFPGQAYLAGPYKGTPLSLAVVVPAVVGPFDFGNVVVRAAIQVDPESAVVRVVSDPLPKIVHGILLRVRDIRFRIDRQGTTLNPTSCDRMKVDATVTGSSGVVAGLENPFQVGGCRTLKFEPRLSIRLKGGTKRGSYPALRATLKARAGDANIGRVSVRLPHSEFLAQEHIGTICTRVQFAADACPKRSIYGYATAITPLLDEPLRGPVYLRSSNHSLPDLVADLRGRIEIALVGRIDSKNKGLRTTFASVPDAPVTRFTLKMKGGKKGLLVNSRNICKRPERALVRMVGHNAKTSLKKPRLAMKCRLGGRGR